jgi:pimeloyl-ACP methyl ester carboxylesterase
VNPALALAGSAAAIGGWTARHYSSPAVRRWRPSVLPTSAAGPLHVRHGGSNGPVVVLLHGLVATGDIFGAAFDQLTDTATVVVPDLLGFGLSLDESRSRFEPSDHLDALDAMLEQLGLDDRPLVLGAHSMGGAVAMRWAQRRQSQVERVTCWGPPIYPDHEAINEAIAESGAMARLFVSNTAWARAACQLNCAHRTLAGAAAAAMSPSLPIPIVRAASLHTWPAYRDAMDHLVSGTHWRACIDAAAKAGTNVELTWGINDRIGNRNYAASLDGASTHVVPDADHHLPITHAELCRDQLSVR